MRFKTLATLPLFALLTSCYYLQSTSNPIKTIEYKSVTADITKKTDRQLLVLLPLKMLKSGKDKIFSRPPHTTERAAPHSAVP